MKDSPSHYRFTVDLVLEDRHFHSGHLNFLSPPELLYQVGDAYFTDAIGWNQDTGNGTGHWLALRRMVLDYESEAFPGEELRAGARVVGRTRRTLVLRQLAWEAETGRVVVAAEMTRIVFDVATRRAIDVPGSLWEAVRAFEDLPI